MRHQFGGLFDAIDVFGDPVEGLQVSQPALALFDIGLQHVTLSALFLVTGVALGQFGLDEVGLGIGEQFLPEPGFQLDRQCFVAGQEALLQQRGADRVILSAKTQAIVDGAAGMADLQLQIPQNI